MKTHIYDTHVTTKDGSYYHFDVLVTDDSVDRVVEYANIYLDSIGVSQSEINQNKCHFCHSEMANPQVIMELERDGFSIIPMQGCPLKVETKKVLSKYE